MEQSNLDKEFAAHCIKIDNAIRGVNEDYLKGSYILTKEKYGLDQWVIMGQHNDTIARFDHEPTDTEIHNAICKRFGLYEKMIIDNVKA